LSAKEQAKTSLAGLVNSEDPWISEGARCALGMPAAE
jgi:hypothetical protein